MMAMPLASDCDSRSYEVEEGICQWTEDSIRQIEEAQKIAEREAGEDAVLVLIYRDYAFSAWNAITEEPSLVAYKSHVTKLLNLQNCAAKHLKLSPFMAEVSRPFKRILAGLLYSEERLLSYADFASQAANLGRDFDPKINDEYCEAFHDAA